MVSHYDVVGIIGVTLGLYSYARLQWQREYAKRLSYSALNLANATLVLYSLSHNWNLSAVVNASIFGLLSAYGVYRCMKYKRKERQAAKRP